MRGLVQSSSSLHGALLRMPAEDLVEMLAVAGLDFLVLDLEHGPHDPTALKHHLALAQVHDLPVLVRPGERDPHVIQRALDLGAAGVLVPHIDEAAAAAEAVRWTRYPPHGERGIATYTRAGRFGTRSAADHAAAAEDHLLLVMLESPAAVDAAPEILATPGVDGYMIGPGDLAFALAHDASESRSLAQLTEAVHDAGRGADAVRTDIVSTLAMAESVSEQGCRLVVHNLAAHLMESFAQLARGDR